MISEEEIRFIERRTGLTRIWRYVGAAALTVIAGFTCYLFLTNPLLINPFHAIQQIEADVVPEGTLVLMAAMLPVVFLLIMFVIAVFVLFVFAAFANERRLLTIIRRLRSDERDDR